MRKTYKLTPKLWRELEGITYSWTNREVGLFGLRLPMAKGWPKLIMGKKYPVQLYEELVLLRYERIKLDTPAWGSATAGQLSLPVADNPVREATRRIAASAPPRPCTNSVSTNGQWSDRPRCERCGEPVYATGGPHTELCEPCLWSLQDGEPEAGAGGEARAEIKNKAPNPF
jgi:hypothetical protein